MSFGYNQQKKNNKETFILHEKFIIVVWDHMEWLSNVLAINA